MSQNGHIRQRKTSPSASSSTEPNGLIETLKETEQEVEDKVKEVGKALKTVLWDDLPNWLQDNHYIHSGYRNPSNSFRGSFGSLFYLHNESANIYSHLIGAALFTSLSLFLYFQLYARYDSATPSDLRAFAFFFLGAFSCLGMSATYHTISNHSPLVARWGNKLDYVGIVCLITGSFIPSIYYGFYCHPHLQEAYWTMICSLGVGCGVVSIFDRFRTPSWRPYRAGMFVGMGLSAVVPVLHGLEMYGFQAMRDRIGLVWLVLQGFLYILGAGMYAVSDPTSGFEVYGDTNRGLGTLAGKIGAWVVRHLGEFASDLSCVGCVGGGVTFVWFDCGVRLSSWISWGSMLIAHFGGAMDSHLTASIGHIEIPMAKC
jgi:adiponectin receptor